jgi:PAS domain S-box-containing protein
LRWILPVFFLGCLGTAFGGEKTTLLDDYQYQWLKEHPNLRIGFTSIPPQVFHDPETGQLTGLCIDYLDVIEKSIGYHFERHYYDTWEAMMNAIDANEIDVVYAAQRTPLRETKYLFSSPYLTFQNIILTTHDIEGPLTIPALIGKKVAVVKGNSIQEDLRRLYPEIILVPVEDELTGLLKLSFYEVDAMIIEPSRAGWIISDKKITNLHVAGLTGMHFSLGYMTRSEIRCLAEILNAAIASIPAQATRSIISRWIHPPSAINWRWLWWTLIIICVAITSITVWNLSLHNRIAIRTGELSDELARRQQAEKQRNAAEEQFRQIIEFSPLGIHMWRLEPDGRLILTGANTAAEKILKMDHRPLIGQELCTAFPGNLNTELLEIYKQVCSVGIPYSDMQYIYRDHQIIGVYEVYAFQTAPGQMAAMFTEVSERITSQEALRRSETELNSIFRAVPAAIGIVVDRIFQQVNDQMCKMLGYSREELLGQSSRMIYPSQEEFDHVGSEKYAQIRVTGVGTTQTRWKTKNGEILDMILSSAAFDINDLSKGTTFVAFDISDQVRVQRKLAESERKLATIMANLPGVAYRCKNTPDWPFEFINKGALELTGYTDHEIISGNPYWNDIIVPDDRQMVWDEVQKALARKTPYQLEYRIQTRDGIIKWVWEQGCGIYDNAGNVIALEGLVLDITVRKQTKQTLQFFQFAIEHSGESAFWVDSNAKMTYVNNAACRQLGYTREELLQLSVPDIDPDFPKDLWPAHWQELREKRSLRFESHHKAKDGTIMPTEITANYVNFEGKEYNCAFVREISERKQFEQAIDAFVQTVSSCVGQDMFRTFAEKLANQFAADMVIIGRVPLHTTEPGKIQTLAVFKDGAVIDNYNYPFPGTPCEKLLTEKENFIHIVKDNVSDQFPQSAILTEEHLRSYIGIPLCDVNGINLGLICVMFRKSLSDTTILERILRIFANQAVMELQRMEGQQELAHSEYRFREMFARMRSAVAIYQAVDNGQDFVFTDFNPAAERTEIIDKKQVLGRRVTEVFPGVEEFGLLEVLRNVWKTGIPDHHPVRLYKDNRIASWRENYIYKLPTGEIVTLYDDVTEQRRAEELIQRNTERLQVLLKLNQMTDVPLQIISNFALEEAIRMTQSTIGYLAFVNDEQTMMTMYSWSKNAMAQCAIENKPIEYSVEKAGLWAEAVRQRKPIICNDYNAPNPYKKGIPEGHVPLTRHIHIPVFSGSKIVMVAGVGNKTENYDQTDIQQLTLLMDGLWHLVERIRAEEAREKLLKEIQSKNNELESIVFVASHDLRSPLINIQGFAGELGKSCRDLTVLLGRETLNNTRDIRRILDEDVPESLNFITAGTSKMDSLVKGLLQIARIGTIQLHIEPLDMNRLLENVLNTIQYQMREYDIDIQIGDLPPCFGDWTQLNQVFSNLIDNAIKYRHPNRRPLIEIAGQIQNKRSVYTIRDNGIGIEREHCDKIFEIFHRLNPAGPVKGEGLGLTIVRRTLDRMNGKIIVESEANQGATFIIDLPATG